MSADGRDVAVEATPDVPMEDAPEVARQEEAPKEAREEAAEEATSEERAPMDAEAAADPVLAAAEEAKPDEAAPMDAEAGADSVSATAEEAKAEEAAPMDAEVAADPVSAAAEAAKAEEEVPMEAEASADPETTAAASEVTQKVETGVSEAKAEPEKTVAVVQVAVSASGMPQKPKRPATSYWLFTQSVRQEIAQALQEKNGKVKLSDVAQETGARWKVLSDEDKKVFEDKVAADKERYQAEMQAYADACDPPAALKRKYAHLIPKPPPSPYALFCDQKRDEAGKGLQADGKVAGMKEVATKLGEMWRETSDEAKNDFQQQYTSLKLEFISKQKDWQATPEFAEIAQAEKAKEERQRAVEAAIAAEAAAKKEQEARDAKKRKRESKAAPKSVGTPPKKSKGAPPPMSDKKGKAVKPAKVEEPDIPKAILSEAVKLGMEAGLRNLIGRPEVQASKKSARAILDALRTSNGLVNPAKRALLGM